MRTIDISTGNEPLQLQRDGVAWIVFGRPDPNATAQGVRGNPLLLIDESSEVGYLEPTPVIEVLESLLRRLPPITLRHRLVAFPGENLSLSRQGLDLDDERSGRMLAIDQGQPLGQVRLLPTQTTRPPLD